MNKTKKRRKQMKQERLRGLKNIKKRRRTEGFKLTPMPRRKTIRKVCTLEYFMTLMNERRGDKDESNHNNV